MNKIAVALLICVVVAVVGNTVTIALLLGDRDSGVVTELAELPALVNEIKLLRKRVDRLLVKVPRRTSSGRRMARPLP